jgi:hydroxymethylglutaryl-CoA lyase
MSGEKAFITECPRDAMQGLHDFIPTELKISYLNELLKVGFDRLDFGSFVSPKAIPQMRDTAEVLGGLDLSGPTELLAIVANTRGAEEASRFSAIRYLGFPFSVSETFQRRNTNAGIADSFTTVQSILETASVNNKQLLVYISMAFGNPYGDQWDSSVVSEWIAKLRDAGVSRFALADTVGIARSEDVAYMVDSVLSTFPDMEIGVHLHCRPNNWKSKVEAAWDSGCRRFDTAIKGFGGCPMAGDALTGNLATENLVSFLQEKGAISSIKTEPFMEAMRKSSDVFMEYH